MNNADNISHFQLVGEFHDTFDHPIRVNPFEDCYDIDPKLVPFRISLMREELKEFMDALSNVDLCEMADALCDLSYVTNGAGHCLGINLDEHVTNMKFITSTEQNFHRRLLSDVDIDIDEINKQTLTIESDINEFYKMYETRNFVMMSECLAHILNKVYKLGHYLKFHMDLMFREVHKSNMTKACDNIEDAEASVYIYEKEGRYLQPSIKLKGDYYVIYDAVTSKILKNHKWKTPNLEQFFNTDHN